MRTNHVLFGLDVQFSPFFQARENKNVQQSAKFFQRIPPGLFAHGNPKWYACLLLLMNSLNVISATTKVIVATDEVITPT